MAATIVTADLTFWLWVAAASLVAYQVATFATTIYLHRCLAHGAIEMTPRAEWVARTLLWLTTMIRPKEWAAVHREHHRTADTELDPTSPQFRGRLKVQVASASLYYQTVQRLTDQGRFERLSRDVPADWRDRANELGATSLGAALGLAWYAATGNGWQSYAFGALVVYLSQLAYIYDGGSINHWGHVDGQQFRPADHPWLALRTAGEGLHARHHHNPRNPDFRDDGHGIDPGYQVIRVGLRHGWFQPRPVTLTRQGRAAVTAEPSEV